MGLEQTIENLLVAIEMYRSEEAKAISRLSEVLTAYGVDVSEEAIQRADSEEIREKVEESKTKQEKENEEKKTEEAYSPRVTLRNMSL